MTVALRSSVTWSPAYSTGASLERTLPPAWPSVVEEASSRCSAATCRRIRSRAAVPLAVTKDARHLDLMHCENERGGCARLTENEAHIRDVGERRSLASERLRDHDPEQALLADLGEGLARESGLGIDGGCVRQRRLRRETRARLIAGDARRQDLRVRILRYVELPWHPGRLGRWRTLSRQMAPGAERLIHAHWATW